ncbi:hypothetical protein PLESTB_001324500 [Pleodorina starrii]|uniref:RCC1-like domain-containing protein n=1 Tax=Pleodorina starrii TaxID=330485 RepID=A0A9W6F6J4_9CHLO|nr:hypothetical protein PLESTM_001620500 [Pleodorina starrii]GLC58153.1 hypothetical protein PLESTB_001324500 [Pleodorina starrii]GLC75577.1 hypothetical protein PLESTF_001659100 [Pleodorina starrii]
MEETLARTSEEDPCVVGVSCGSSHSVALLSCDVVASWGRGEDGQLGHGQADECLAPKAINALTDAGIESVVCGAEYTIAVAPSRGQVYSWGWGDFGRLGHGDCNDVFVPRPIEFFSGRPVSRVACGDTHTLVVAADTGELFTFGRNQNGQLGLGHTNDCLSPQRVVALQGERVRSVACGSEHSLAATESGAVFAWGWGRYGNLGDGESQDRYLPTRVVGLEGVRVVSAECGWRHSAVVSEDGRVFTFGWSKYGQLGHGDHLDRTRPCQVAALRHCRITTVAGGWRHTMAADSAGNLYAWGWNKFGQLGLGDMDDRSVPTRVATGALAGQQVALLACGWRHTLCVTATGRVYSWGRGVNGQLGHGEEQDLTEPTLLSSLSRGQLRRDAILATADGDTDTGLYVAPADRYAVVPGADEPYGNGSAAVGAVPSMSLLDVQEEQQQQQEQHALVEAGAGAGGGEEGRSPKKARISTELH